MVKFLFCIVALMPLACANQELKREQAELHLRIGTGYLSQGKNPQALEELLKAEVLDDKNPVVQNNLGLAYYVRKEFAPAEAHISQAIKLSPRYSDARNNLGRLYIDLARYDDAIGQLSVVARDLTYPTPEKAYLNLGIAYLKKGDLQKSLNVFRKSMEANTHFCPAYNFYGQALFQEQKYADAIDSFEKALTLCHDRYDEAHYYSALSYYKAGQIEKATARLEEVERLYPESEYSTKAKAMLKIIR